MKTNAFLTTTKKLRDLSSMVEIAYSSGNIDQEEYRDLKKKIYAAKKNNIFAAMAAYCRH